MDCEVIQKVFCLLSGGIDSTTTMAAAKDEFPVSEFEAVTVDYGQRHVKEIESAKKVALAYEAEHVILDMTGMMTGMLIEKGSQNETIPDASYADLPEGISPTYVSFRNGLMLAALAARAQAWVMQTESMNPDVRVEAYLYCGVHADDGVNWAYPDCTPEFIGPMAAAIYTGSYNKVRLRTPLLFLDKPSVVRMGSQLRVDYSNTWSCYKGEEKHCGVCPTCRSRKEAFELTGIKDPTEYAA